MANYPTNVFKLKQDICEIGRRIWQREYVAANDGNISIRIGENRWLCTPTGVSKGYLKPEMICIVDDQAEQISGSFKRTSEIRMHIAIGKKVGPAECGAVIHTHAPYATAYALAGLTPPNCIAPEVEVFTGPVGMAPYETPGNWDFANKVAEVARPGMNTILLKSHGVVTWGATLEKAYFQTEIIDGYCRVLMLAQQLGGAKQLPKGKVEELLELKAAFGMPKDARLYADSPYELCGNDTLGRNWCSAGTTAPAEAHACACQDKKPADDQLVKLIADAVEAALKK